MKPSKHATWQEIHRTLKNPETRGGMAAAIHPHNIQPKPMLVPAVTGPGTVVDIKFSNPSAPPGTTITDGGGIAEPGPPHLLGRRLDPDSPRPISLNQIVNDAAGILGSVYQNAVSQYNAAPASLRGSSGSPLPARIRPPTTP